MKSAKAIDIAYDTGQPGYGRLPFFNTPMRRITVTLPEGLIDVIRRVGEGNISAGARVLMVEALRSRHGDRILEEL